jgi:hypothetical protein
MAGLPAECPCLQKQTQAGEGRNTVDSRFKALKIKGKEKLQAGLLLKRIFL